MSITYKILVFPSFPNWVYKSPDHLLVLAKIPPSPPLHISIREIIKQGDSTRLECCSDPHWRWIPLRSIFIGRADSLKACISFRTSSQSGLAARIAYPCGRASRRSCARGEASQWKEGAMIKKTTNFDTTLRRRMGLEKIKAGFTHLGFYLP